MIKLLEIEPLLKIDFVTPQTRAVLEDRLSLPLVMEPQFFSTNGFKTLYAACARLIPQTPGGELVDLAGVLDTKLKVGKGKGWRYDSLPSDCDTFLLGLEGIDGSTKALWGKAFHEVSPEEQDVILLSVQQGNIRGAIWDTLPAQRFFEELLAEVVAIYYSHPIAKSAIGDRSFADARGWKNIGLHEADSIGAGE